LEIVSQTIGRNPVAVRNSRIGLFLQNSNRDKSDARRNARKCVGYVLARARGPLKKRTPLNFDRETTLSASRSSSVVMVTSRRWEAAQLPWSGGYLEEERKKAASRQRTKAKIGSRLQNHPFARSLARKRIE
jgi:hypothetical protein